MQKIKSLFVRDKETPKLVTREVDPDCQWVIDGEGVATEKYDGSACAYLERVWYARHKHDATKGSPPIGWLHWSDMNWTLRHGPISVAADLQHSGHGWIPIDLANPSHRWHVDGMRSAQRSNLAGDGTYELVGPKVQQNPYKLKRHEMWRHGATEFGDDEYERNYDGIEMLVAQPIEGIVWHHPDGRYAKIKRRDFGLAWPIR